MTIPMRWPWCVTMERSFATAILGQVASVEWHALGHGSDLGRSCVGEGYYPALRQIM